MGIIAVFLVATSTSAEEEEAPTPPPTVEVQLQQGAIEGLRSEAGGGRFFYSFKTIPFAQPPVGDLRFEASIFFFFFFFNNAGEEVKSLRTIVELLEEFITFIFPFNFLPRATFSDRTPYPLKDGQE